MFFLNIIVKPETERGDVAVAKVSTNTQNNQISLPNPATVARRRKGRQGRGKHQFPMKTKHINNTPHHVKRQTGFPYKTIKRNLFVNMHRSPLLPGKHNVPKDSAVKQALLRDSVSKITTKTIYVACTVIIIYTTCYLAH